MAEVTPGCEEPQPPPASAEPWRLPPARQAWAVVVLALLLVIGFGAALEVLHRGEVTQALGRPPPDWSDPQVRHFASALAWLGVLSDKRFLLAMQEVAAERPSGEVTAQAAGEVALGLMGASSKEDLRYARLAIEAVPPDSPRLAVYYGSYARQLERVGRAEEASVVLRQGLAQASTEKAKETLLANLLQTESKRLGPGGALAVYQQYARQEPAAAASDATQYRLAEILVAAGRVAEGRAILQRLAQQAEQQWSRDAAQKKLQELGEAAGGH